MRRPSGLTVGLVAALVLGAGFLPASPASAQEGGSVGGCLAPCDAATTYLADLGYLESELSSNPGRCRTQCAQIRGGCLNAVTSAARCYRGSAMAILSFEGQSCLDLQSTAQRDCRSGVAADTQDLDSFLRDDRQCGKDSCESSFQACLLNCNQQPE